MSLEGDLTVRLAWDGRRVLRVDIASTRPLIAGRLVAGRSAADAAAMLPRLYSICGRAQGAAARSALAAAAGEPTHPACAAHEDAVVLETIQEYLWRLSIDWPRAMGRNPVPATVAAVRQHIGPALRAIDGTGTAAAVENGLGAALLALADEHVYGEPVEAWLARTDAAAFDGWAAAGATLPALLQRELTASAPSLGRSATMLMPPPCAAAIREAVLPSLAGDPAFSQAPTWGGMTVETGALARMRAEPVVAALAERDGHTVAVRMAARLVELAQLVLQVGRPEREGARARRVDAFAVAAGEGVAAVETARGLLLHRAVLANGRVADYRIVAPTEWNFHPAGPLVQGLEGDEATDAALLERNVRLAVEALDPCVACNIEIAHA